MTRGTIHLIGKRTITYSEQFNGDMYLEGHGANIIERLLQVKDLPEFIKEVRDFNKQNHRYRPFKPDHKVKYQGSTIKCKTNDPISDPTHANYTYWKNLSGKNITFIDINGKKLILEHGGVAVFYYAERYLKTYFSTDK